MKQLLLVALLFSNMFGCFAQDIEVKKFVLLEKDQTVTNYRNDSNGNPCALLLVQSLKEGLEFEGWVVGDVERKDDAYWVYVANGAKHVKIKHADFQTKDVVFGDYGTSSLKGGQAYSIELVDDTKDIINKVYCLGWNLSKIEVPASAQRLLTIAANRGDKRALIAMLQLSSGEEVRWGEYVNENKGLVWIEKLLALNDTTCLDSMPGDMMFVYACKLKYDSIRYEQYPDYSFIEKQKRIYTKISEFELKACLKGYAKAGDELFSDYPRSNGLVAFCKDVELCCRDSAALGNRNAMICLGSIYEKGICTTMDLKQSAEWYLKASDIVSLCRVYGNSSYPSTEESLSYIRMKADEGMPEALFQLGLMYEEGRNVTKDTQKAEDLYRKTNPSVYNQMRHKGAATHLAGIYYEKAQYKDAEELLRGITEPDANYLRALMRFYGYGTSIDKVAAYNLMVEASKAGYEKATEFMRKNF